MAKSVVIAYAGDISISNGGTNRVVAIAKSLSNANIDVHLVVSKTRNGIHTDLSQLENVYIYQIPIVDKGIKNQLIRAVLILLKAKKVAKKNNSVLQVELASLAGIAHFLGCHDYILDVNDISFKDPQYTNLPFSKIIVHLMYSIERAAVLNASKIIAVSNPMKDFIANEWDIEGDRIVVIPNGYFSEHINPNTVVSSTVNMIARMGTLFQHFNEDIFIKLARVLETEGISVYLIGDGIVRQKIEMSLKKENINNVTITGWLPYSEAMSLAAQAQFLFLAEKRSLTTEVACPVKILDYAALKKPMVISDTSELSEIARTKGIALVSIPEDQDSFIQNVRLLLNNEPLQNDMSLKCEKFVKEYSWDIQGGKFLELIIGCDNDYSR